MSGEDLAAAPPWLGELVRRSQEAMAAYDLAGTIVYVNEAAGRLLLVEPAELVGTSVFDLIDAEDLGRVGANLDAVADGAQPRPGLINLRRGDGSWALLEISQAQVLLPGPPEGPGPVVAVEIRDNALSEAHWNFLAALSRGEPFGECIEMLTSGLSNAVDGQFAVAYDEGGTRRVIGPVPAELTGLLPGGRLDTTEGMPWQLALTSGAPVTVTTAELPPDLRAIAASIGAEACVYIPVADPGESRPALIVQCPPHASMAPVLVEALTRRPQQAVTIALDRRYALGRLEHLAHHDALTNLVNRGRFFEVVGALVAAGDPFGVCYVDLDRFKPINDDLGHKAGDQVIVACAQRLMAMARGGDVVARMGGDEFVVACPSVGRAEIESIAERIVAALSQPVIVGGQQVIVGASVGCAVARPGDRADDVVAAADTALYEAKRAGRGGWRWADRTLS